MAVYKEEKINTWRSGLPLHRLERASASDARSGLQDQTGGIGLGGANSPTRPALIWT